MKRLPPDFLTSGLVSLLALLAFSRVQTFGAEAAVTPLRIESGVTQLFIDDYLIGSQTELTRRHCLGTRKADHEFQQPRSLT